MRIRQWGSGTLLLLLVATALIVGGCSQTENKGDKKSQADKKQDAGKKKEVAASNDSGTWWCKEHGIPEHICGMCDAKYAEDCKKKGDWCKEHDRPESQCFICHPEHEVKFVAMYEARYGKKPPAREKEPAEKEKSK